MSADERILCKILRISQTPRPAQQEVHKRHLQPVDQLLERSCRAGLRFGRKLFVARGIFDENVVH